MIPDDGFGRTEKNAGFAGFQHVEVVIAVADGDGFIADRLEGLYGRKLRILDPQIQVGQEKLADTFGSLNQFADYNTAFTELQAGALDALAIDIGVAKYQINNRGEGFVILDESLNSEQYAVGFRKGNNDLALMITNDLITLTKDGTVKELAEKYEIADMVTLMSDYEGIAGEE